MDETLELVFDTLKKGKQALVFTNTKSSAEKTAEDISIQIKEVLKVNQDLADKVSKILPRPTKQCQRLALCLKKGIAFHHAGLAHKQKELIEENFKKGVIKIICCTPTLAWGLDLPAYRVILKDLRRFGAHGLNWIPTLDYLQMAGRAGRPSYDTVGEAIAIAKTDIANKEIYKRYITGEPEDIISKLAVEPVLRTYVLSLIATGFVSTEKEILDFFSKTFWAHQYQDMDKLSEIVQRMLGLLEEYKFIISSEQKEDFQSASNLIDYRYKPTLIGKRVAELYIDPLTANYLIKCVERAAKTTINEFSFLQVVSNTLEMRPLLRVGVKDHDKVQEESLFQSDYILDKEPPIYDPEYEQFLHSIKTAMFLKDWINEYDEEYLLQTYKTRPGEIKVKLDLADWLLYCTEEFTRMLQHKEMIKEIKKLRIRIKHGAKEELLPLLKLKGIGRIRARKLFTMKIKDIGDVKKTDYANLSQLLGAKIAQNIKEQVGQKVIPIKKGARKGQTSIQKYAS